jgi:hypothetical protein
MAEKLGAKSVQLEMEVAYWFAGKMFDYVATKADGTSVAVSVTRVFDNAMNEYCDVSLLLTTNCNILKSGSASARHESSWGRRRTTC